MSAPTGAPPANDLVGSIFAVSGEIRYVAVLFRGRLVSRERANLAGASSSESDKYEELIVNPSLLALVTARGNIDCGGVKFVVVRYGNFFQAIFPMPGGHVSVGIEPTAEPPRLVYRIRELVDVWAATPPA